MRLASGEPGFQDQDPIGALRRMLQSMVIQVRSLVSVVPDGDLARLRHALGCFEAWSEYADVCHGVALANFPSEWDSLSHGYLDTDLFEGLEHDLTLLVHNLENEDFSTTTRDRIVGLDVGLLRRVESFLERVGTLSETEYFSQFPPEMRERAMLVMHNLINLRETVSQRLANVEGLWASVAAAEDARKAKESAAEAQQAAGITGDAALSSFYSELAQEEKEAANNFRKITVTMAFLGAAATALFVMGPGAGLGWLEIAAGDYVHLIQRAVFITGVFGLAGYFARQAHQHRSMANWASALAVQLKTFDAYVRAIESADVKDELRKTFGARVFGEHPAMKGEPTVTPSAAAMDTAVGWAAKLTAGGK